MKKKPNCLMAGFLTMVFVIGLLPVPQMHVLALSPNSEVQTESSPIITANETEPATYTVTLDLAGGTQSNLETKGWTMSNDQWAMDLTEPEPGKGALLSVGAPTQEGFLFTGWFVTETDETVEQLTEYSVNQDLHITATWQEESQEPGTTPKVSEGEQEGELEPADQTPASDVSDPSEDSNPVDEASSQTTQDTEPTAPTEEAAGLTVELDLNGGTIPEEMNPGEGWTQDDGVWHYTAPETVQEGAALLGGQEEELVIFRLPTPTWESEAFQGWTVLSPADGSVSVEQDDAGYFLSLPAGSTCAVTLQARSKILYTIDFQTALYPQKFDKVAENTIQFSHVNINYPMEIEDVLGFLNSYVSDLQLDYTVTYTDTDGVQHTVQRSGVTIPIDWEWQEGGWQDGKNPEATGDFREIVESKLEAMDGEASKVRLNDQYLKEQIVEYEKTVSSNALPSASELDPEDINFSNWGTWDENQGIYKGGDADLLGLDIKIGADENKTKDISGNKDYMIETVSPSNVTLNLFDYWILSPAYYDQHADTPKNELYNEGINQGHGLTFRKSDTDGIWNNWTGTQGGIRAGIVKDQLDENGYPNLNLRETFKTNGTWTVNGSTCTFDPEENLAYLFDPDLLNHSDDGKAYSDVQGLFKVDDSGNYYYSSHDNFAEFDPESNSFNVYNAWGVKPGGSSPEGQFFPFNTADQVFKLDTNGNLTQNKGFNSLDELVNHYLGMTMEAEFQQPVGGMVSVGTNAKPMVFEFSGDDDVWIFIDDVLVADLGGIHDEATVKIDFSTGEVVSYLAADHNKNRWTTTLKKQFEEAGVSTEGFRENTFGNNTRHTLKLFYLERGNTDSNLTLSFNLMEPANNTLIKLDQNGQPLDGVEFSIYPATQTDGTYTISGEAIGTVVTKGDGTAAFPNYDFSQHDYYILQEKTPEGYFSPGEVVLRYDRFTQHPDGTTSGTNLLLVENRWTTGAVGNFSASVHQAGTLKYETGDEIDRETGSKGLILAVPLLKGTDGEWHPLYGSNMVGFHDVEYETDADKTNNQRRAVLKAALYQIYGAEYQKQDTNSYEYGFPEWYLEWDAENGRYEGNLIDLPGDASRYYWASGDQSADLSMAYYFMDLEALSDTLGLIGDLSKMSSADKLAQIAEAIESSFTDDVTSEEIQSKVEELVTKIDQAASDGSYTNFALLDVSDFNRVFSSRIYVPNVSPELTVLKLDQAGDPLKDATFTLYYSEENTDNPAQEAQLVASGKTNENGVLVFSKGGTDTAGSAKVTFEHGYYWVKETNPPTDYTGNDEYIPVYVTENGRVYADALEEDDGITVRKGLGRLLETMVRYAAEDSVNVTLRDITAQLVTGENWEDVGDAVKPGNSTGTVEGQKLHLHYGLNNALLEYGTHAENGVVPNPYFEVDKDIAGIQVEQDYYAHEGEIEYSTVANKIDLKDTNIRGLFTGATAIVVRNRQIGSQGAFSVAKTVTGSDSDKENAFLFDVSISGTLGEGQSWENGEAEYTVTQENETGSVDLQKGTLTFKKSSDGSWKITAVKPASGDPTTYFQQDANNDVYQLKLKDGQKISVSEVPFGLTVTVSETSDSASGYITTYTINNGNRNSGTTASGEVKMEVGDPSFHFYNHKDKVANLTLEKLLPAETDSTRKFTFDITLRTSDGGSLLAGTYDYTITDKSGTVTKSDRLTNGQLTVQLGHEDKLVIQGLPVGTSYIIRETTAGYAPAVKIDGTEVKVVDGGTVTGTVKEISTTGTDPSTGTTDSALNKVEYANTRSGSITITKRSGVGTLLSGAGFTLYTKGQDNSLTPVGAETFTALAKRCDIDDPENDSNFDKDTMRYTDESGSYVVHTTKDNGYFYYRFLTENEISQYYNGTLEGSKNVEAIVQFTELSLDETYAIQETTVPDGYVQNADIEKLLGNIKLPWKEEGGPENGVYDVLFTVTNHEQMVLPFTGLGGIKGPLAAGLLLMVLAGVLLWVANRKKLAAGHKPGQRA